MEKIATKKFLAVFVTMSLVLMFLVEKFYGKDGGMMFGVVWVCITIPIMLIAANEVDKKVTKLR